MLSVVAAAVAFIAATVATTVIAVVVAASATAAVCRLELFGCGIAHFEYFAFEAYVLAGQRVVEVHDDFGWGYINHDTVDMVAVGGHHGGESAGIESFVVEFAVDHENVFRKCHELLGVVRPEALFGRSDNVEVVAGGETFEGLLKCGDEAAGNAENGLFGVFGGHFMQGFFGAVGVHA